MSAASDSEFFILKKKKIMQIFRIIRCIVINRAASVPHSVLCPS